MDNQDILKFFGDFEITRQDVAEKVWHNAMKKIMLDRGETARNEISEIMRRLPFLRFSDAYNEYMRELVEAQIKQWDGMSNEEMYKAAQKEGDAIDAKARDMMASHDDADRFTAAYLLGKEKVEGAILAANARFCADSQNPKALERLQEEYRWHTFARWIAYAEMAWRWDILPNGFFAHETVKILQEMGVTQKYTPDAWMYKIAFGDGEYEQYLEFRGSRDDE